MNPKKILIGVAAATAVSVASASTPLVIEKQSQAATMSNLLKNISVVLKSPECSIKQS